MTNTPMTFEQALSKEQTAYGYSGKPKAWQEGFDRGFKEAWQASQALNDDRIAQQKSYYEMVMLDGGKIIHAQAQTVAELVEALGIAKDILEAHTLMHVYDALIAKVKGKI